MATPRPTVLICATCKKGLTRRYIYCAGNCASVISLWTCGCPRAIPSRCQLCLSSRLAELLERTFATIADDHGEPPDDIDFYGEACSLIEEAQDAANRRKKA